MKKLLGLLSVIGLMSLSGCGPASMPNLLVQSADPLPTGTPTPTPTSISITEINNGNASAGAHLTYVEVNQLNVPAAVDPQCQYSLAVPEIAAGGTWTQTVLFTAIKQGCPAERGGPAILDLSNADLVIRVDVKNQVDESNEGDNVYRAELHLH